MQFSKQFSIQFGRLNRYTVKHCWTNTLWAQHTVFNMYSVLGRRTPAGAFVGGSTPLLAHPLGGVTPAGAFAGGVSRPNKGSNLFAPLGRRPPAGAFAGGCRGPAHSARLPNMAPPPPPARGAGRHPRACTAPIRCHVSAPARGTPERT